MNLFILTIIRYILLFFDSTLGISPRRSCEATFDRLMKVRFLDCEKGFKLGLKFEEIESLLLPLFDEEDLELEMLSNTYL